MFKQLLSDNSVEDRRNAAASGIAEKRTEKYVLLHTMDTYDEMRRAKLNESTEEENG